jgi:hypothetical protein
MLIEWDRRLTSLSLDHLLSYSSALCIYLWGDDLRFAETALHQGVQSHALLMRLVVKPVQVELLELRAQSNGIKTNQKLADSSAFIVTHSGMQVVNWSRGAEAGLAGLSW